MTAYQRKEYCSRILCNSMELSAVRRDHLDFILRGPEDDDYTEWDTLYYGDFVSPLESALELHYLAREWNWDDGKTAEVMTSIINHPLCDRGTALLLYWDGAAPYLERNIAMVEEWERPIAELARRVKAAYSRTISSRQTLPTIQPKLVTLPTVPQKGYHRNL